MAIADTAKLLAVLDFKDNLTPGVSKALGSLDHLESRTATLGKLGNDIGRGIRNTAQNIGRLGVAGAGLLTVAITNGVHELERLESATAQTNAVLESTQDVSGQTAESIRNLAEKYEGLNATISDKVIQGGENLLLTFTNIRKDAFEPTLQAALDMNQAMGGGEEGLQNTIIQIGKALQDPIRGLTALRRVGVNFTEQQKKQIKDLISQNKLYDAQQIILKELGTEFGGSFAAAGDTAAGKFAKVRDAVEDAQASLATAFLPVLEKVADKLATFLADPATVQRIEDFGGQLAGGFDKLLQVGGSLPWKEIGDAFAIVGTGSKALLDAFLGLPPWVQTAVLTGWGLNKLTGGALGSIAGDIGKLAVGGLLGTRGASPANPVWVQSVGGGAGGPGVTPIVAGGFAGVLRTLLGAGGAVAGGAILGNLIGREAFFNPTVAPAKSFEAGGVAGALASGDRERLAAGIASIDDSLHNLKVDILPGGLGQLLFGQEIDELQGQRDLLQTKLQQVVMAQLGMTAKTAEIQAAIHTEAGRTLDTLRGQANTLTRIESKPTPDINVAVTAITNVGVSNLERTLISNRIAGSGTIGGFTESAF